MTNKKHEALIFADDRPSSIGDDLYQWAGDAEDMIRCQHARIAELEADNASLRGINSAQDKALAELEGQLEATCASR